MNKLNKMIELVFAQCFHCLSKKEIHMRVQSMKYKLCNFSDSADELNSLIFTFKIGMI